MTRVGRLVAVVVAVGALAGPAWATGPLPSGSQGAIRAPRPAGTTGAVQPGHAGSRHPHHRREPDRPPPAPNPHHFGPSYPFGYDYRGPFYPFGPGYYRAPAGRAPVQVAPPPPPVAPQWVPGYWGRQWVPQYRYYEVFVPGYFGRHGWVPGYYDTRAAEAGGHYEQVWVDGYWTE